MQRTLQRLQHGADFVAASMLAVMFAVFILQIAARYISNLPVGWTVELCLTLWLGLVLWGAGFCLGDKDHVKFDLVYEMVSPRTKRIFAMLSAAAVIVALVVALPASWDYVSFYKIKKSATLRIPLNYIFVIYIGFCGALILRYAWGLAQILRGRAKF
ncbi:MAG: TRAP transporter small permease subunit [Paracoccaceae bacterium]|nr:TRAP transporter small permease subunit [Paracoccaceae bacterium]